jgi:hypothetical protein
MLSWIPLLGPILQGLFSLVTGIYSKFQDTKLGIKVQEVEEAKVSAQIIHDTNDDICLRLLRDAAVLPVVVWTMLIGWDTIISSHRDDWMWHVNPYPDTVAYLPYVVLVFLFGNIGLNMWNRK